MRQSLSYAVPTSDRARCIDADGGHGVRESFVCIGGGAYAFAHPTRLRQMDDRTHHHTHTHGGRAHVHASVDHLANDLGNSTRLAIRLDSALMAKLGVATDAVVRVATERGRSILVRVDPPFESDAGTGILRLDRFVRQALKAHLNESVEVEAADIGAVKRIELNPAVDVTMAHDLVPHIKNVLTGARTPASIGAVLYVPFPNSHAGTTYQVHKV